MLELQRISAGYGEVQILREVSLEVPAGGIVTVVGANGAGKTTTIRAISGTLPLLGGRLRFQDEDITAVPAHRRVERGLVQVPEGRKIFAALTVRENLELGSYSAKARARRADSLERVFHLFPLLRERIRQPGGTLSGGEQQMLAIGRGLMALPSLLMLDEPSLGLAPLIVRDIFRIVAEINRTGTTVLLVEQNVQQSLALATRGYVLENGAITRAGSGEELLADPYLKEAYLGL
ncbi:MAG TPA: ABC transporter ATP-binding protein [bacterium]|nr:ABC transporter ATP-binding protein [bacterium]